MPPTPPSQRRGGFSHVECSDPHCPICSTRPETPAARRGSMRTLFEFRARRWWVVGMLCLCLGLLAFAIAFTLIR